MRLTAPVVIALLLSVTSRGAAQSTISQTDRYAYSGNAGWTDFLPSTPDGVRVTDTFLAGYAYAANFGFISFGNGAPANGHTYSNLSSNDYGVNVSPTGALSGFAYAANIGFINFEQTYGKPRINLLTGQFSGSAYSGNLGWIALDTTLTTVATVTLSRPDSDGDGIPDAWEKLYFNNLNTATATGDADGDGASDLAEYQAGTNPTDRSSVFQITNQAYNPGFTQASLTFTVVPTRLYRIDYTTNLAAPWTDSGLGTFTPAAASTDTRAVNLLVSPRHFFRAVSVQPLP